MHYLDQKGELARKMVLFSSTYTKKIYQNYPFVGYILINPLT